jgi:septum site-determining protein MinC
MAMSTLDRPVEIPADSAATPAHFEPGSLLVARPVRSGQSVVFEKGDVTIIGSVASGAEVIAGGSIHIYGRLRGRAIAGLITHAKARIFCHRMEAELLAIDGIYQIADNMDQGLRGRAVQAWLQDDALMMAPLD